MIEHAIHIPEERVVILDFGSQYTQLIARRVREMNVYAEIVPYFHPLKDIIQERPGAIILSGGPSSLYEKNAPRIPDDIFNLGIPVLGICYGLYLVVNAFKGTSEAAKSKEYGRALINIEAKSPLFTGLKKKEQVWMSHGDKVVSPPKGFSVLAASENAEIAAIGNDDKKIYGVQFHPEVYHTINGGRVLHNFLFKICGLKPTWTMKSFIETSVEAIKAEVGSGTVLLGLSGGVDSSVTAVLLQRALGDRLYCVFVDNGVLRKDEAGKVIERFKKHMKLNLIHVNASKRFLDKLKGVEEPEKKRRIIGREFIAVFMEEAKKIGRFDFLAQGTLYPDVIESVSTKGPSDTIKSHHNRVPEVLKLIKSGKVIEPLKELFKDEVRLLGKELGMPDELVYRHPFPGPGLAIRIIGEVTPQRIRILQEADDILIKEIRNAGLYDSLWQVFAVFLPVRSVGVMGDKRTYENVIALRGVTSVDAMTADWAYLPENVLRKISNRIINEVKGVNRVVYDISSKPPSTIEWE
ncbi:MAG TPA: glutamine-hydrolyzing GMP synthase [Spirochaetota bacterium]|nr:glutamine-hydrolyzing GMP synthase [Spirochaetota bacterium]HPI89140.1 glutamine-hydrolyzing GMP synthase [Spirochaetota bacterium]HPR48894.1 glutamine-hydrolyzing GMP synthase [Spirochaetota bacterium]